MAVDALAGAYAEAANGSQVSRKLEGSLKSDLSKATDEELMNVCKEFEAYFTEQVFKSMQKMVPESKDSSSANQQMKDYYKEELIKQYAASSSERGGLGIAQMLYEQMKRNYDMPTVEETNVSEAE
ncbi:flagellar protein FlgJ [Lachnospiraceae bacterium XBB1006]|nr:flagellar protein FlgJ [Lachnospiraceae bacterium XBB1006]